MRDRVKPLLLVLAIPVLATALSMLARNDWEARWESSLVRQLAAQRMRPDARLLARYSLASVCGDPRTGARLPPCRTYNWHSFVIRASAGVGGAGFLFLGALLLASSFSRGGRSRFVRLFRPSLVAAAAGTALLAVANGLLGLLAMVAAALYLFGSPVERVSVSLLLITGTAAAVWTLGMIAAAFSVTRRPTITLVGRRLEQGAHPRLTEEVRRAADAVDARPPDQIVACLAPALFVTELNVACLDGLVGGRTLCVSLPLCRILSVDEFRALLAHELSHFSREHEGYARRVAPFYTGALRALDTLGRQARGIRTAAVAPPRAILAFFLDGMREAAEPGEAREFDADARAGAAFGHQALASALVKAHAFGPAWHAVWGAMFDAVSARTQYVNASQLFQDVVASNAGRERLIGIGHDRHVHPTDRHPTLAARLTALALDPARVADAALAIQPAVQAVSLIDGHEAVEQSLSAAEHQLIAVTGGHVPEGIPA
jgi:Zn-dependent protease with chaperone function